MSLLRKIFMNDGAGNPLNSYFNKATGKYSLDIHDADVHTRIINKYLHQHTSTQTTLANPVSGDGSQYTIDVVDATGFAVGDYLHINTSTIETTHPIIISSSPALPTSGPATFTLDRRLDFSHAAGDEVIKSIVNMAPLVGTLANPQEYFTGPAPGEVWHLTRLLFEMTHATAGDLGKFGNLTALTNGAVLRARINGQYGTFTNWKTNSNMKTDMFDVEFDLRSGGGGDYGTSGRGTFKEAGAIIRLDGDTDDRVELYIQDDISGLITYTMKLQGHLEDG
jgi:hypothetical protein